MRITLAQINLKIGDIKKNLEKIIDAYKKAEKENSDIIVFPELTITGYPPMDILENRNFIEDNIKALDIFKNYVKKTAAVVGFVGINNKKGKKLLNSIAFIENGKIKHIFYKNLLPTYDVFEEKRYFEEGNDYEVFNFKGKKILLTVCEDIWADTELLPDVNLYKTNIIKKFNPDIIINISASPYYYGKQNERKKILKKISTEKKAVIIYVNCYGGQDSLVFDGSSMVVNGNKMYQSEPFKENTETIELDNFKNQEFNEDISSLEKAIITGIKDYFEKQEFKKAILGVSGGIDSAVVSCLLSKSLGSENVFGLIMPSKFTSNNSISDAVKLLNNLKIKYEIVSINDIYTSYLKTLKLDEKEIDITIQNIQARIRANILMAYSNKYGYIVINTSNKSEIAMGYSTMYGDSCGAISPIGDVLKTDVYRLSKLINSEKEIIPISIINRAPTAELKPNQKDEDDLPPYKILDKVIKLYIEEQKDLKEIEKEIDPLIVNQIIKRIEANEYKRKQFPLIIKVSKKTFGIGRIMPIVKFNEFYKKNL
jgi:NAD+ synthase (glutamine-hydrolysing)